VTDAERLARLLEEIDRDGTTVMELVCATRTPEPWRLYPASPGSSAGRLTGEAVVLPGING
jgi:hypothetical protein